MGRRVMSLVLAACLVLAGLAPGAMALETEETGGSTWEFAETEVSSQVSLMNTEKQAALAELKLAAEVYTPETEVVAFVVMEDQPLVIGGKSINKVSESTKKALLQKQDAAIAAMEKQLTGSKTPVVRYRFTYLTNAFTVKTAFGDLEKLLGLPGVKSVFIAPSYTPSAVDKHTVSSGQRVGVPAVWNDLGYTGKGMKIAIIDTGLDLDHPSFAAAPETTADSLSEAKIDKVLTELNAYGVYSGLTAGDLYRSEKVPFAFNYTDCSLEASHDYDNQGDHGTHVSGIAAANALEGAGVVGMAPDAQIVVMKVFGRNGAYADVLVAALEDAMRLECDVANMSLGSPCGFSSTNTEMDLIYQRLATQDIIFTASAGNEGTSSYANMWGTNLNLTENIENSTVSEPSTYANAMSIASAENAVIKGAYFEAAGRKIFYQDNYDYLVGLVSCSLMDMAGWEMEYVIVPGLGGEDSYYDTQTWEQITDVEDRIAVIRRGDLSFSEKVYNAEMMGAVAVIIWDNNEKNDIFNFNMATFDEETGYYPSIPVALISCADGAAMAEAEEKALIVSSALADRPGLGGGEMSSFSSWGTTSDLRLLPDITGVGGNVYSCLDGGQYGLMSGTSMSAPQVAGISALMLQYLREKYPGADAGKLRDMAEALLMSTADVMTDSFTGLPYAPRQQGAGLVDADGAVLTDSYLTVGGKKPKAELGDSESGAWKFTFEVHNFGKTTQTYDLSAVVTAPGPGSAYGKVFMQEASVALGAGVAFSADSVTLAPGEQTTVTATLQLTQGDKSYIDSYFPNGNYVEGFVYLETEDGQDLNLPFMGFYGDWTDAPVFDTAFWYDNSFFGVEPADGLPEGSIYYHALWTSYKGSDWVLGLNPYSGAMEDENGNIIYNEANNVISPNGDGALDGIEDIYLSLMRNAKELRLTYSVGDNVLHRESYLNVPKTIYRSNYGQIIPWIMSWYSYGWDFWGVADGTTVDLTIEAFIDYGDGGKNELHIPITVDLSAPELTAAREAADYLVLEFKENVQPAAVYVQDPTGTQIYLAAYDFHMTQVGEDAWQVMLPMGQWGSEVLVTLCDYAGNENSYLLTAAQNVQWVGKSLSTSGTITVNFYAALSSDILADENARMVFTLDGKTQSVPMDEATLSQVEGVECYRFDCHVPAKNMADTISAQMYGTQGAVGEGCQFSVAMYYDVICETYTREQKPALFDLVEGMLNYGAASQLYFGHNVGALANAKVPGAETAEIDASAFAGVVTGTEEGAAYVGSSLILDAGTTLRVFFRLADDAANHSFTVNGKTVEAVRRGGLYYIELDGIAAKNLDDVQTFTCGGITVETSALSYVNSVLKNAQTMDAGLVALCQALYRYNQAANGYYA